MLETASAKIDRFGWDRMDQGMKDGLCGQWCAVLGKYRLDEVQAGIHAVFVATKGALRSINEYQVEAQIKLAHRIALDALPKDDGPGREPDNSPEAVARRRALSEELLGKAASSVAAPRAQSEAQTRENINKAKSQIGE